MFLLGLEEGSLPRRSQGSPFIADEERRSIDERSRQARLVKPDSVSRERFFFYTACTRPSQRLYLVREAASDEGSPREPSPFWDEVRALFAADDVARWTQRRSLAVAHLAAGRGADRAGAAPGAERARGDRCRRGVRARAWRTAGSAGSTGRAGRSRGRRRSPIPCCSSELRARTTFGVTELEGFADCSSIWFIERVISPRTIDGEVDARLRGSIAHQTLYKFFSGIPKRLGIERLDAERLDDGLVFLRECLAEAIESGVWLELRDLQRRELEESLWRDLEHFVREEAESPLGLVPRRFEVSFGSDRSAPELQSGLQIDGFAVTGKIDRIDLDPFSARGIVQDYKSGKTVALGGQDRVRAAGSRSRSTCSSCATSSASSRSAGSTARSPASGRRGASCGPRPRTTFPASRRATTSTRKRSGRRPSGRRSTRVHFVERIRSGEVRHDPKGGFPCPTWCDLWSMCRVARS